MQVRGATNESTDIFDPAEHVAWPMQLPKRCSVWLWYVFAGQEAQARLLILLSSLMRSPALQLG
jgi:hypothetical protein